MAVTVISAESDTVVLQAPLAPNINHRETVFGGSASALAILASWALLHVRLQSEGIAESLVIQRNSMEYLRPILGPFTARSMLAYPERWPHFTQMIASKGKARVSVAAMLEYAGEVAGSFTGEFVALRA
jgi:thioesterase domain-containing protein